MIGEGVEEDPTNLALRGEVGLGHQVLGPLAGDAEPADPFLQHAGPRAGRCLAYVERIGRRCRWHRFSSQVAAGS